MIKCLVKKSVFKNSREFPRFEEYFAGLPSFPLHPLSQTIPFLSLSNSPIPSSSLSLSLSLSTIQQFLKQRIISLTTHTYIYTTLHSPTKTHNTISPFSNQTKTLHPKWPPNKLTSKHHYPSPNTPKGLP